MGAEQSFPAAPTDARATLERWFSPYHALPTPPTPPPTASADSSALSDAHTSLDVTAFELDPTRPEDDKEPPPPAEDPVDAAMARIVPAPVAAMLRSPQVSGEMAFAAQAAQKMPHEGGRPPV